MYHFIQIKKTSIEF